MHGCSLGFPLLANAKVEYMGGVVDGGVGIGTEISPRRTAIKKAQAKLRQEYDVREERRRELEFLEKGGNPLDFKLGDAASVSVQSTSRNDQHHELFVSSDGKGSFALTASPHGDSVESSGRPGAPRVCEPNYADNLLVLDGQSENFEGETNSVHPARTNIAPLEQLNGSQNAGFPQNRAYKRRNGSRSNRGGARSRSKDMVPSRGGHASSLASRRGPKDVKGSSFVTHNQEQQNFSLNCNSKPTSPNGSSDLKVLPSDSRVDRVLDNVQAVESTTLLTEGSPLEPPCDIMTSKSLQGNQYNQHTQVDAQEISAMVPGSPEPVRGEQVVSAGLECQPCVATAKAEDQTTSGQLNGFSDAKGDRKSIPNKGQNSIAAFNTKGLESESSCSQTIHFLDGKNGSAPGKISRSFDSNGDSKEQRLEFAGTPHMEGDEMLEKNNDKKEDDTDSYAFVNDGNNSVYRSQQSNDFVFGAEEPFRGSGFGSQNEVKSHTSVEGMEVDDNTASETETKPGNSSGDNLNPRKEYDCSARLKSSTDSSVPNISNLQKENPCGSHHVPMNTSIPGLLETILSVRGSADVPEQQISAETSLKVANKAHEDSILEEARIIEAKRKRIAELSVGTVVSVNHRKSHWDSVLEEMAWLANDFAQERLWKITAAAQVSHQIASTSRLRFEEQNLHCKQKRVAHTLAKAIMEFWHSAQEMSKEVELQCCAVQRYAVRFLKYNNYLIPLGLTEAPAASDGESGLGIQDISWEDHFTEENLFYAIPEGAMETYRKSIETHLARVEKTGGSIQEEVETSIYDAAEDFGSQDYAYEEDEGETSTYCFRGGFAGKKPSKFSQKKRKNLTKTYVARSYDLGTDSSFIPCMETSIGPQQSLLMGKRPANSLNVGSIPTKRLRTAPRPRVLYPVSAGTSRGVQGPNKTDASSDDTNSFQDDQGTLHGGSQTPNGLEVESVGDFEKQLPFDSTEVSKPKRKKKAKHLGSTYEQRWQLDNEFQNEPRDLSKRRLESHQLESNGSSGLSGLHLMKKQRLLRQSLDNPFDNLTPMSISSPAASQVSNMSNPSKLAKILAGRDRVRKAKSLKMPAGQLGLGSPWSLFEDQALVVLVHDMGPNWELVSDAINGSLQYKCIFRNPKECMERHKNLMDRTAGDWADSAEDSGSSQPYPSTLPGIPKGSARQLFQRLQGPMEEEMIKTHFEKIIMISQKLHFRRTKIDNEDAKPIQPHGSHTVALSEASPNNLNGGTPLTPLDLCDTTASSPDILSLGYQAPHAAGLAISNQSAVAPVVPASGAKASLQGLSNMVLGNNFSSSGPVNVSVRDGRYGVPRSASLPIDEQQRMQQYNQKLSGRNIQHSGLSVSGAPPGSDCGIRMLSGGSGMGIMSGMNRSIPIARPGCRGIAPSPMLNSGSMLSSSMPAVPSPVNMHPGVGSAQGNSILRPQDALNMMQPVQYPEHQRQMMVPELQMQVTQGNSQGVPPFGGLSCAFSNQASPPPVHTYPLHQQQHQTPPQQSHMLSNPHHPHHHGQNHISSTQHQAYAIHHAKERQLKQRLLQQQQHQRHQQCGAPNTLMPHVPPHPQLPISSSSSQVQPQTTSAPVLLPLTQTSQQQQKLHMPPNGMNRNTQTAGGGGLTNPMGKQRQRQPQQQQSFQQSGRHHPQQRQQSQSQQQAKLKGVGQGNMPMHQNLTIDPSRLNGLSRTPSDQSAEKAEQVMHLMQGQDLYPGSGLNPVQPSKSLMPPHPSNRSHPQQQIHSGQAIPSSKQVQQLSSRSDIGNERHVAPTTSGHILPVSHQSVLPSVVASNHKQLQSREKLVNKPQTTVGSPVDSSSGAHWRTVDQMHDSVMPNPAMQLASVGSPPSTNSSGTESLPTVSQGLGQGQSGIFPSPGLTIGSQWQQLQSQLQPPATPPSPLPPQSQHQQLQHHLPPQSQSQHLQLGDSSLYIRPTNSSLE